MAVLASLDIETKKQRKRNYNKIRLREIMSDPNKAEEYRAKSRAYYERTKDARREYNRNKAREYRKDPIKSERIRATNRKHSWKSCIKSRYGVTHKEYERMFKEQEGKCLLCKGHPDTKYKRLYVDHCHKTGKVRGLLCNGCNTAIGQAKENPELLRRMADYVM